MKLRSLSAATVLVLAACAAPSGGGSATPLDQAATSAKTAYDALDTAILSADAAVKANMLKGSAAATTLDAFTKAKAGLDVGLTTIKAAQASASAASGAK